jgi:hypothetical protein
MKLHPILTFPIWHASLSSRGVFVRQTPIAAANQLRIHCETL